jgi:hypothetical protein
MECCLSSVSLDTHNGNDHPPHHRQWGGCLQCTRMWPKHWQL